MKALAAAIIAAAAALAPMPAIADYFRYAIFNGPEFTFMVMIFDTPQFEDMACTLPNGKRATISAKVPDAGTRDMRDGCWVQESDGNIRVQFHTQTTVGREFILDKKFVRSN